MRDFSKVSPTLWKSKKFRSVESIEARYVYGYLLTCPHGNSAGCFDLHPMYACADLGLSEIQYLDCINTLSKAGLIECDDVENTVLITNWLEFNEPANAKHAAGILLQLDQVSSTKLKAAAFHGLRECIVRKKFDREHFVRNAIQKILYSIDTVSSPETETETETEIETEIETRPDLDKTETRENPRAALRTVAAEGRDGLAQPSQPPNVSRLLQTKLMKQGP